MSNYFVLVRDIKNNKEYIYNNIAIEKSKATDLFKDFIEYQQTKQVVKYLFEINDTYCELFRERTEINRGWIWNEETKSKDVDFVLTLIELCDFFKWTGPELNEIGTITEDCESDCESESTTCTYSQSYSSNWYGQYITPTLQKELFEKLSTPNFGLRPVNNLF